MIILLTLILTITFLIMAVLAAVRKDPEKAPVFLIMALLMYMTYSTAMYQSSFEYKAYQLEQLVRAGLYQY
jgi:hypothetical protein